MVGAGMGEPFEHRQAKMIGMKDVVQGIQSFEDRFAYLNVIAVRPLLSTEDKGCIRNIIFAPPVRSIYILPFVSIDQT